jgi:magnesium transporter
MAREKRLEFGASVWRDFGDIQRDDLEALGREYGISSDMILDCLDPAHLPKVQKGAGASLLMLRSFDQNAAADETTAQGLSRKVAIFWGEGFLLTVHRAALPWLEEIFTEWQKKASREPGHLAPLLHQIVEEAIFTFEEPIDRAALAIDDLEDKIFQARSTRAAPHEILETAYLVKKRATIFKRLLRLTRDTLPFVSKLGDPSSAQIQDLKEEAERLYFYADDLTESANDLIQLSISLSSNRMNEVVRLLTIFSIFILPLNFVTGIYGMNFEFMPELKAPWGYPAALAFMFLVELGIFWVLKRKGWIRSRGA